MVFRNGSDVIGKRAFLRWFWSVL